MAISLTQAVSGFNAVLTTRANSVRDANSLTQKIPALATPGVAITIGANAPAPLLYNPAGLLRALTQLDAAGALPSGADPGIVASDLQGDLETVLGLNSGTGGVATSSAGESFAGLSAASVSALNNVLAAGVDEAPNGASADRILQELLAQALNAAASGVDRTAAAASALNAAGVLRAGSATDALRALNALPAANLELAASALESGSIADAGRLPNSLNDASSVAFNRLLAADMDHALTEADAGRPRRRRSAAVGATDLLLSGASLLSTAAGAATLVAETEAAAAQEIALAPDLSAESLTRLALRPLLRSGESAPDAATESAFAADNAQPAVTRADAAQSGVAEAERIQSAAAGRAVLNAAPLPPGGQADGLALANAANIVREPRYAELAAAMSMSAAVYRYQASVSVTVPPGEVDPARTVRAIQAVPQAERIG